MVPLSTLSCPVSSSLRISMVLQVCIDIVFLDACLRLSALIWSCCWCRCFYFVKCNVPQVFWFLIWKNVSLLHSNTTLWFGEVFAAGKPRLCYTRPIHCSFLWSIDGSRFPPREGSARTGGNRFSSPNSPAGNVSALRAGTNILNGRPIRGSV